MIMAIKKIVFCLLFFILFALPCYAWTVRVKGIDFEETYNDIQSYEFDNTYLILHQKENVIMKSRIIYIKLFSTYLIDIYEPNY